MKKIIRAIFALVAIGVFIFVTQISCQKSTAQTNNTATGAANLILYSKYLQVASSATDSSGNSIKVWSYQFYLANIDGSNQRAIPISMPSGYVIGQGGSLTPDGKTIIFTANNQSSKVYQVYSCKVDGSNLKKLVDIDVNTQLLGAY